MKPRDIMQCCQNYGNDNGFCKSDLSVDQALSQLKEWILRHKKKSEWIGVGTTNFRDINVVYNQALTDLANECKEER